MKKETTTPISQDYIANNPHAAKDIKNKEDKRKDIRQENTNHFTNREGYPEKK